MLLAERERDVVIFAVFEIDFLWKHIKILGGRSAIVRILRLPWHSVRFHLHPCYSTKNPLKQSTRKKPRARFLNGS